MARAISPTLLDAIVDFFLDRTSPSPISEEVHSGLVSERDALCDVISAKNLAEDGHGTAQGFAEHIRTCVREAEQTAHFCRTQAAPTSHTWTDNLFHAIVQCDFSLSAERHDALLRFDRVA